ncbi:DUF4258 domain-containing protein [Larkinella terrae]|uniref:DUF4258 domain-containing protein n=1 Tax=Larkinella terrae TaxID=2025311 RepID=A0A7K0EN10_9BACT|nr:DUF4258 domain-containing protein [Larkinella terrae]MRS62931.1 DUF4258 domain-containing protein [Larkinella terrae]
MENETLFVAQTPLGFTVSVEKQRWELIVTQKHPVLLEQEELVKATLENPDEIRRSRADESGYLLYKTIRTKRWICAFIKKPDNRPNFLITAYPTDAIKEGEIIWKK